MTFFFDSGPLPPWVVPLLIKTIIALPIAYFAKRKGYNYWSFLIAGILFSPIACIAILLALPKIVRYVGEDEAIALKDSSWLGNEAAVKDE